MPAIIIGNRDWMAKNSQVVQAFLAAALEGGEAVKTSDTALTKAAEVSAAVYKEQDTAYWKRYARGVTEQDKQGNSIPLGGSATNGLGDNAYLFGLNGADNIYKRVYTVYGGFTKHYYPKELPELVPYDQVVNTSYLQALLGKAQTVAAADTPKYEQVATKQLQVTGKRAYSIEFETGKASFTPNATRALDDLLNQTAVSGMIVQVNGHTDNVGDPTANLQLSKARADAVKQFLVVSGSFPDARVKTRAYGDTQPIADNKSAAGKAKNRRVEVLLLSE
jgi:outer membrane protein OmpA-like peptidoglycan-associated protein